ncbi:class I SAM-dependent methyltransferase [Dactylosporangium sp. CA-092794]|uniref:class I SAM-dependent methyltransferase n=1 Tax=Dactylosporangium sp. CA-092794 TaxID=3239929 RepID=UPI003D91E983
MTDFDHPPSHPTSPPPSTQASPPPCSDGAALSGRPVPERPGGPLPSDTRKPSDRPESARSGGAGPSPERAAVIAAFHGGLDGPSWRIAGWGSARLQRVRFDALVRTSGYRGGTVLDWGCGPGDLYFFLRSMNLPLAYAGVDIDPRMVELARSRGVPNVELLSPGRAPVGEVDYVFASGIFQFADPADPFYYLDILEHAYDISRLAAAANFLSGQRREEDRAEDELYADPAVLARFAGALTDRWVIDHGYHPAGADFTIALLKQPS